MSIIDAIQIANDMYFNFDNKNKSFPKSEFIDETVLNTKEDIINLFLKLHGKYDEIVRYNRSKDMLDYETNFTCSMAYKKS